MTLSLASKWWAILNGGSKEIKIAILADGLVEEIIVAEKDLTATTGAETERRKV